MTKITTPPSVPSDAELHEVAVRLAIRAASVADDERRLREQLRTELLRELRSPLIASNGERDLAEIDAVAATWGATVRLNLRERAPDRTSRRPRRPRVLPEHSLPTGNSGPGFPDSSGPQGLHHNSTILEVSNDE